MPAKAGIQKYLKTLDSANGCALLLEKMHYVSRLRGNDAKGRIKTFYESINFGFTIDLIIKYSNGRINLFLRLFLLPIIMKNFMVSLNLKIVI